MVRAAWWLVWLVLGGCDLVFTVDDPVSICAGQKQLELCVPFDETTGDIARDGTANHNDAALVGVMRIPRGLGQAIHVDVASVVKITHTSSLNLPGPMTIDLAVAADEGLAFPNGFLGILDNQNQYAIRILPGLPPAPATVSCVFFDVQRTLFEVSAALGDTKWHRITCVKSTATIGIYIDSSLRLEKPMPVALGVGGTRDVLLGQAFDSGGSIGQHFVGGLDDVRIFARALTPDEIRRM